jgi:hypothetical protein
VKPPSARLRPLSALLVCAALSFGQGLVRAAPTTEVPTSNANSPTSPGSVLDGSARKAGGRGDAGTIEMLVEMQQPTAGLQFNERQRPADGRARPAPTPSGPPPGLPAPGNQPGAATARSEPPPVSAAGLFGAGATPQVQQTQQAARAVTPGTGLGADGASPSPRAASGDAHLNPTLARWLALPREVIEYVRENRTFVLGSAVAFLLAAWTGSLVVSRLRG